MRYSIVGYGERDEQRTKPQFVRNLSKHTAAEEPGLARGATVIAGADRILSHGRLQCRRERSGAPALRMRTGFREDPTISQTSPAWGIR